MTDKRGWRPWNSDEADDRRTGRIGKPQYVVEGVPEEDAQCVVGDARHLSPFLGERKRAAPLMDRPVFMREFLPQELKVELETVTREQATSIARFLANVVGRAHARQMDASMRENWTAELNHASTGALEAPAWLWRGVVDLLVAHERAYLEHCRRYALQEDG